MRRSWGEQRGRPWRETCGGRKEGAQMSGKSLTSGLKSKNCRQCWEKDRRCHPSWLGKPVWMEGEEGRRLGLYNCRIVQHQPGRCICHSPFSSCNICLFSPTNTFWYFHFFSDNAIVCRNPAVPLKDGHVVAFSVAVDCGPRESCTPGRAHFSLGPPYTHGLLSIHFLLSCSPA